MSHQGPPPPPPNWGSAYPSPQYPPGYPYVQPPAHPQATTAMVLGIIGIAACGLVAPFAWVVGSKAVNEIDASPGTYGGRSEANAGRIMGIVGSCIIGATIIGFVLMFGLVFAFESDSEYFIGGVL